MLEIAERVEGLTGPCRATDALVWARVNGWPISEDSAFVDALTPHGMVLLYAKDNPGWEDSRAPAYTASLDAVVALIGEKLPDRWYGLGSRPDGHAHAFVTGPGDKTGPDENYRFRSDAATPALALLAAALRALATLRADTGEK